MTDEIIYTWLQNARICSRKAKGYKEILYKDKHYIVIKALQEIKRNKIKTIKYKIDKDNNNGMILVHFYFKGDFKYKSVSFHMPSYYESIINKNNVKKHLTLFFLSFRIIL